MDVEALLRHLGIRANRQGDKLVARCPSPDHDDGSPSWSIVDAPGQRKNGSHHCKSCGFGGGPWELAAAVWDLDVDEAGERLRALLKGEESGPARPPRVVVREPRRREVTRLPKGVQIPGPDGEWYGPAIDYLEARGVSREQADRWGFGYALRGRLRYRIVMPVVTAGELVTYTARAFASGVTPRYMSGREKMDRARPWRAIFGEPAFRLELRTVTVAEGIFGALALERAGAPNPGAILGSDLSAPKIQILRRFDRVVIATDPDKAGDKVEKVASPLARHVRVDRLALRLSPDDMPADELREAVGIFFS